MEVKTNDNIRSIKPAHFAIWRMDCFYVGVVVSYRFLIKKEVKVPSVSESMDNNYFFLPDQMLFLSNILLTLMRYTKSSLILSYNELL